MHESTKLKLMIGTNNIKNIIHRIKRIEEVYLPISDLNQILDNIQYLQEIIQNG